MPAVRRPGCSSALRPHHLKNEGVERGVHVRVGSTNRRADAQLIAELGRYAQGRSYDEQPMPGLDSEAIDFAAASESLVTIRELRRPDLETLRRVTVHQGRKVPTVAGVLLYGGDRARHFSNAWIQAGRFAGQDRSRILDHVEIRGPLPQAVQEAVAFVDRSRNSGPRAGILVLAERGRSTIRVNQMARGEEPLLVPSGALSSTNEAEPPGEQ